LDLVITYGITAVLAAVDDVASGFESDTLEEIGSSDVSCWMTDLEESLRRRAPPLPAGAYVEVRTDNGGQTFGCLTHDYVHPLAVFFETADGHAVTVLSHRIRSVVRRYPFTMTVRHRVDGTTVDVYVACKSETVGEATAELVSVFGSGTHEVTRVTARVPGVRVQGNCEGWTGF
jgi:hypothetical protein